MKKFLAVGALAALAVLLWYIAIGVNLGADEAFQNNTSPYASTTNTLQNLAAIATTSKNIVETTSNKRMPQSAIIHTNKGNITVALRAETPKATANFAKLSESGFYDGVRFHRVIKGFMIQAGDPQSKDLTMKAAWGTGGPGYKFEDELSGKETYEQGTLAMANAGPNTNGSQFFIMTGKGVNLPPSYTVFGKVTSGIETVLAIESVSTDATDKPTEDIIIKSIEIK